MARAAPNELVGNNIIYLNKYNGDELEDPDIFAIKCLQKVQPNLLSILSSSNIRDFIKNPSLLEIFDRQKGKTSFEHDISRCYTTRMFLELFFMPNGPNINESGFEEIHQYVLHNPNEKHFVVLNISMGGKDFPDHTFSVIYMKSNIDNELRVIIIQSFYYEYNLDSKYGVQILKGNSITNFEESLRLLGESINNLQIRQRAITNFSLFTGIDITKHSNFIENNQTSLVQPYLNITTLYTDRKTYVKNMCANLKIISNFISGAEEDIQSDELIIQGGQNFEYYIYDAFIDGKLTAANFHNLTGYSKDFVQAKGEKYGNEYFKIIYTLAIKKYQVKYLLLYILDTLNCSIADITEERLMLSEDILQRIIQIDNRIEIQNSIITKILKLLGRRNIDRDIPKAEKIYNNILWIFSNIPEIKQNIDNKKITIGDYVQIFIEKGIENFDKDNIDTTIIQNIYDKITTLPENIEMGNAEL
jgi:hypothetical protein